MLRYKGALYKNIWLKNGYKTRDTWYGFATSVKQCEELQDVIYHAVYHDDNFRTNEKNIFELTDQGWINAKV